MGKVIVGTEDFEKRLSIWGLECVFSFDMTNVQIFYTTVSTEAADYRTKNIRFDIKNNDLDKTYKKIKRWVNDFQYWNSLNTRLMLASNKIDNLDIEDALLAKGFKWVEYRWGGTNFIDVELKYCYVKDEKFHYDGVLNIVDKGNIIKVLKYLDEWVSKNPQFRPTASKYVNN